VKSLSLKVGPILGFIGGLIMVVVRVITLINGLDIFLLISTLVSMLWGVLAIAGFILTLTEKKIGYYLVFIAGIGIFVGMFIPISGLNYIQSLKLTNSFYFIDVALMLIGGILSIISVRKE